MNSLSILLAFIILCVAYTGMWGVEAAPGDTYSYCNDYIRVYEGCQYYGWGSKWGYVLVTLYNWYDRPSTSVTGYSDPSGVLTTTRHYRDYAQGGTDYSEPFWLDNEVIGRSSALVEISRGDDGQNFPLYFNLNTKCGTFTIQLPSSFTFCFLYQQCGVCT